MSSRLQRQMAADATWLLGALFLGSLAVVGTVNKLGAQRKAVDAQQAELGAKELRLTDEISAQVEVTDLATARGRLFEANALVDDEARRISLISSTAEDCNMRLVSLRSGTERPTSDPAVIARRHELVAIGDYRDLAKFVDTLQAAEGSVAIDSLEISSAKNAPAAPTRRRRRAAAPEPSPAQESGLRITLEVIWLGIAPNFDELQEEPTS